MACNIAVLTPLAATKQTRKHYAVNITEKVCVPFNILLPNNHHLKKHNNTNWFTVPSFIAVNNISHFCLISCYYALLFVSFYLENVFQFTLTICEWHILFSSVVWVTVVCVGFASVITSVSGTVPLHCFNKHKEVTSLLYWHGPFEQSFRLGMYCTVVEISSAGNTPAILFFSSAASVTQSPAFAVLYWFMWQWGV